MHLYLITRGIKHSVDEFITELQGKYLPTRWPDKDGVIQPVQVQVSVRPVQFWEIVYPEEHNDLMLMSIFGPNGGKPQHKRHNKFVWTIRKLLKLEPMPETFKQDMEMPIFKANIEMIGVGIKKDYWIDKDNNHIDNPTEEQKKEMAEGL